MIKEYDYESMTRAELIEELRAFNYKLDKKVMEEIETNVKFFCDKLSVQHKKFTVKALEDCQKILDQFNIYIDEYSKHRENEKNLRLYVRIKFRVIDNLRCLFKDRSYVQDNLSISDAYKNFIKAVGRIYPEIVKDKEIK